MILILDDNQFRRKSVFDRLRLNGYMVSAQEYSVGMYMVKPVLTVFVNPTNDQIKKIKRENTKYLIIKKNKPDYLPSWMSYIPLSNEIDIDIERFFWNNFEHENPNKISIFGCICIEGNKIALGGALLDLKKTEMRIAKFFIYNNQKKFSDYELTTYFRFITKSPASTLVRHIYHLNGICRSSGRPPLLSSYKNTFWLNNNYLRYNLEYANDCYDDFLTEYKK